MTEAAKDKGEFTIGHHIVLRCPHCGQKYEARLDNNPLVRDGLVIEPLPLPPDVESETEQ